MRRAARVVLALAGGLAGAPACTGVATSLGGRPGPDAGLLRGKSPVRSSGVTHVDRLTDGIGAAPDDPPRTDLTSVMASASSFVLYDLGADTNIACAAIEADGDDSYTLAVSSDGVRFTPVWTAGDTSDRGMQPRVGRDLGGRGRYLRLTASGGDGSYAVAEVAVAATCPSRWPPAIALPQGTPIEQSTRVKIWAFAACAAAFILAYRRRAPDFIKLLIAVPLGLLTALAVQFAEMWPPPPSVRGPLAAAAAIVAGAAVARALVRRAFHRPGRG